MYSESIQFFSVPSADQTPVNTAGDLPTTFPNPIVGEHHMVIDEGIPYYWTGATWSQINNSGTIGNIDGGIFV
jgi:hypothetical protein